jgi:hypothetical protein
VAFATVNVGQPTEDVPDKGATGVGALTVMGVVVTVGVVVVAVVGCVGLLVQPPAAISHPNTQSKYAERIRIA